MGDFNKNEIFLLERKVAFLEEKLHSFEKNTGPLYYLIPVRVFDLQPINDQDDPQTFLLAVINNQRDTRANVIKVTRQVLAEILEGDDLVTFDDYVMTDHMAEKRMRRGEFVWDLIS